MVYGHKSLGKTQFLFFVFRLLQAVGEKVLFLDRTLLPLKGDGKVDIDSETFCGHFWRDSFTEMEGEITTSLDAFYIDTLPKSFGIFLSTLRRYIRNKKTNIWIIIDEVVLFENFPIDLPREQDIGPFHWIITGSAGIGSWVGKQHLGKLVFDLPPFSKAECVEFTSCLSNYLDENLEDALGVPSAGIDDWIEEKFGGVVGYISELLLDISKGITVSSNISMLNDRIHEIFTNVAGRRGVSANMLALEWLSDMEIPVGNRWNRLRDAGLCGSSPPRGVIFASIVQYLCKYAYTSVEDRLSKVSVFRKMFAADAGLDGCLLELEEILKLSTCHSIEASCLKLIDQTWAVDEDEPIALMPPTGSGVNIFAYDESHSTLIQRSLQTSTSWNVIELPHAFNVIDVVLVNQTSASPEIYGIQITRSRTPFTGHQTFDTCSPKSKERLNRLWCHICSHFDLDENTVKKFYLMLAPNCKGADFRPPDGHSSDFYFSPYPTE